ncbi:MAG: hypothetical protein QUV05_22380 [Phycisphaerae bacterium]|nr:hypothetical protein [Phycisphaerae bacterium]
MPEAPVVPVPSVADMALGDLIDESLKLFFPVDTVPDVLPNSKSCGVMHAKLWRSTLELIAADEVANRPGRIKPRVLQRRRHRYPLMQRPRRQLRRQPATALSGW